MDVDPSSNTSHQILRATNQAAPRDNNSGSPPVGVASQSAVYPDFRNSDFLRAQLRRELAFFHPRAIDPAGGFFHYLDDDGSVYDAGTRHLVNSARMVFCYALGWRLERQESYRSALRHGLAFLEERHRQPAGGYAWILQNGVPVDRTQHCYGMAFVLLAQAHALRAGIEEAGPALARTHAAMQALFWSDADGLFADEASPDGVLSPYRGQNANMHSCEALIAAFEATGKLDYLHQAELIARNITLRQAELCNGWIWEHYRADWSVDWHYNRDDPTNMFRPWGYQPGHLAEWAKLLLILERYAGQLRYGSDWLLPRAEQLFSLAVAYAWDNVHGGLHYGLAPDLRVCDSDKYFWVQAESLATAGLLALRTGKEKYDRWYERIWRYSWDHMIDQRHGGWHRILRRDNVRYGASRPPHGKTDFYHPMGAYVESLYANNAPLD